MVRGWGAAAHVGTISRERGAQRASECFLALPERSQCLQEGLIARVRGFDVGFLIKTPKVAVADVTQYGKDTTYIDPNTGAPAILNDRPPLVLRAAVAQALELERKK